MTIIPANSRFYNHRTNLWDVNYLDLLQEFLDLDSTNHVLQFTQTTVLTAWQLASTSQLMSPPACYLERTTGNGTISMTDGLLVYGPKNQMENLRVF